MATLADRRVSQAFSGLLPSSYVALGVLGIGLCAFESLSRWKRRNLNKPQDTSSESHSMAGYLYQARCFQENAPDRTTPRHSKWPLLWIWQVLRLDNYFYVEHSSLDAATYVRILRGFFYFTLSQACTVLPTLLAVHLHYSPDSYSKTDINRASLAALVSEAGNTHLLWVHTICLYWMTGCFMFTIYWIGNGILKMREKQLQQLARSEADRAAWRPLDDLRSRNDTRGYRHRTLVMTNIPNDLRSETAIVQYFTEALSNGEAVPNSQQTESPRAARPDRPSPESPKRQRTDPFTSLVTRVILVRRTQQLHEVYRKREALLNELEKAHILLAKNVLKAVAEDEAKTVAPTAEKIDVEKGADQPVTLDNRRRIVAAIKPFLTGADSKETIWEALRSLPPELLDPFQPLYRVKSRLFKGQSVPAIDYYLAKFNLTTAILEDMRASPEEAFATSPTAFVTFRHAHDARRLLREMPINPKRTWACKLSPAPDARDIEFDKLVLTSFKGDVLRGFLVEAGIWLFTIFWVIPVSALLGLVSVDNIAKVIPSLLNYFARHQQTKALLTTLVPTLLLSILLFLIPTMLIQLSNHGQRFFTISSLHNAVLSRYWKFVFADIIIIFCAGTAAVEAVFKDPGSLLQPSSLLNQIASAFPAGATFFIGYTILATGIHSSFELMLLGFPWINHISVVKAVTPRQRFNLALPRSNLVYTTLPNHMLILSILFVFALLNPLVIAFNLIYISLVLTVMKRSFAFYYWSRNYQLNGKMHFIRFSRYSLDALMTGQVIIVALMWTSKQFKYGGACIPVLILTAGYKLAVTRVFNAYSAIQDVDEASIASGTFNDKKPPRSEILMVPLAPAWLAALPVSALRRLALKIRIHPAKAVHGFAQLDSPRASVETAISKPRSPRPVPEKTDKNRPTQLPAIVVNHAHLQRDDRTDFEANYDNPYLVTPLSNSLWLPRNPQFAVDLNDCIDYMGLPLTSSGTEEVAPIGQWQAISTSVPSALTTAASPDDAEELLESPHTPTSAQPLTQKTSLTSLSSARTAYSGSELIAVSRFVAERGSEVAINDSRFSQVLSPSSPTHKRLRAATVSATPTKPSLSPLRSPTHLSPENERRTASMLNRPPSSAVTLSPPPVDRSRRAASSVTNGSHVETVPQDQALRDLVISEFQEEQAKYNKSKFQTEERDRQQEMEHVVAAKSVASKWLSKFRSSKDEET